MFDTYQKLCFLRLSSRIHCHGGASQVSKLYPRLLDTGAARKSGACTLLWTNGRTFLNRACHLRGPNLNSTGWSGCKLGSTGRGTCECTTNGWFSHDAANSDLPQTLRLQFIPMMLGCVVWYLTIITLLYKSQLAASEVRLIMTHSITQLASARAAGPSQVFHLIIELHTAVEAMSAS